MNFNIVVYLRVFLLLVVIPAYTEAVIKICKTTPNSPLWPSNTEWNRLNTTVGGRLYKLKPVAAVCYPTSTSYNTSDCIYVTTNYATPAWRESQPSAVLAINNEFLKNQTCPLVPASANATCYQGGVSYYAVNATTVQHVTAAVKFAILYNLRIVVKSSGHDFLGRSSAPGSLLIWTRYMKGMNVSNKFRPYGCGSTAYQGPAVTVHPGDMWYEVYPFVNAYGYDIVGGAGPTVSASGGYATGGGHSPLGPKYGLAVDNIHQFEVVTALGKYEIVSECSCNDLFWALRGGGGGAFAVVISVTYKIYPALPVVAAQYSLFSNNKTSWLSAVAHLASMQPTLSDLGWAGYYYPTTGRINMLFWATNSTLQSFATAFAPFQNHVATLAGLALLGGPNLYSNFSYAFRVLIQPGGDQMTPYGYYGSRLIPRSVHENNPQAIAQAIWDSQVVLISAVGGGEVNRKDPDCVAATPAWRKAIWHAINTVVWTATTPYEQQLTLRADLTARVKLMRDITPGSGAYFNEMDVDEPYWQLASFGSHYPRLLLLKKLYDPLDLFLCHHCVGSELWDLETNCKL